MQTLVLLQNLQNKTKIPEIDEEQLSTMFIKRLLQSPCDPVHRCANALDVDARNRGKRTTNPVTMTAAESSDSLEPAFVTFDEIQTCFNTEDIRQFSSAAELPTSVGPPPGQPSYKSSSYSFMGGDLGNKRKISFFDMIQA
eukprot:432112-Hanusia_phi.AAC.1